MFNTYFINLDKDIKKAAIITDRLNRIGIKPTRFPGIYGKDVLNSSDYKRYFKNNLVSVLPFGMMGCALSHFKLMEHIYQTDCNKYALILEDDAMPIVQSADDIVKSVNDIEDRWDVLLLYCQGICYYKQNTHKVSRLSGSMCAYLVRVQSIPKILEKKIYFHFDLQRNFTDLVIFKTKAPLFMPDKTSASSTSSKIPEGVKNIVDRIHIGAFESEITNYYPSDVIGYDLFRVGNVHIATIHIIILLLFILIIVAYRRFRTKS
jgi:hypothetical protein